VGYIVNIKLRVHTVKVSDILKSKGNTLYTITPEDSLQQAMQVMAEKDIGSLVVMSTGRVVGMLTFREVILAINANAGAVGAVSVYRAMDNGPLVCTPETELDEVRRMMLQRHARYMPVVDSGMLMGVISFYDVAKAVVDSQNFENKMLKAYIRDWPEEEG
jgi:CBS domain-containing protein